MAITAANLTSGVQATAGSSVSTASISPGANKLDIVSVESLSSIATGNVPTVTGASGTWTQIATQIESTNLRRVTLFRDLSSSPGSGALTIDFAGQSQSNICWTVDEFSGTELSGTHGSGAIVQSVGKAVASSTTTGVTITLAALGSTANAAMGAMRNSTSAVITAGGSFTQLANVTSGPAGVSVESEWALNQTAVAWTWASQTVITVGIAIEIKAPTAWVQNPDSTMPDANWI